MGSIVNAFGHDQTRKAIERQTEQQRANMVNMVQRLEYVEAHMKEQGDWLRHFHERDEAQQRSIMALEIRVKDLEWRTDHA